METTLTNENLEDKNRYPQPVTIRELLQDILVLIVYSMFAFSMLNTGGPLSSVYTAFSGCFGGLAVFLMFTRVRVRVPAAWQPTAVAIKQATTL